MPSIHNKRFKLPFPSIKSAQLHGLHLLFNLVYTMLLKLSKCVTFGLLFLWLQALLIQGVDLTQPQKGEGPLGVALDYDYAITPPRKSKKPLNLQSKSDKMFRWTFSSILTFEHPVEQIEDEVLAQMVFDAYDEMGNNIKKYQVEGWENEAYPEIMPTVMTLFAYGHDIILASSQRGSDAFIGLYGTSQTAKHLQQCRAEYSRLRKLTDDEEGGDTRHAHGNHCGEILALYLQEYKYPAGDWPTGGRMISCRGVFQGLDKRPRLVWRDPCGDVRIPDDGTDPKVTKEVSDIHPIHNMDICSYRC